jgi:hypothetical protein
MIGRLPKRIGQSFSPAKIPNLGLWMDASRLVFSGASPAELNDPVTEWACRQHGMTFTQGTLSARPVFIPTSMNGRPALRFDGTDDLLSGDATARTLLNSLSGVTIFVVGKTTFASGSARWIYWSIAASTSPRLTLFRSSATETFAFRVRNSDTTTTVNTPSLAYTTAPAVIEFSQSISGSTGTIFQNGVAGPSGTSGYTAAAYPADASQVCQIGNQAASWLNGDVSEILVYQRTLTNDERASVRRYLGRRYGITVS